MSRAPPGNLLHQEHCQKQSPLQPHFPGSESSGLQYKSIGTMFREHNIPPPYPEIKVVFTSKVMWSHGIKDIRKLNLSITHTRAQNCNRFHHPLCSSIDIPLTLSYNASRVWPFGPPLPLTTGIVRERRTAVKIVGQLQCTLQHCLRG